MVAVACANPTTGEAYQIKGTAELVNEGEAYEHYCKLHYTDIGMMF